MEGKKVTPWGKEKKEKDGGCCGLMRGVQLDCGLMRGVQLFATTVAWVLIASASVAVAQKGSASSQP
jgi:hypothetical protein